MRNISMESNFNEQYFKMVFEEYFIPLTHFAQKFLHDQDTSKEIVHTVFYNLWVKRDDLDMEKSIKSYLYTSTHNRCLNYIRDHKKFDTNEPTLDYLETKLGDNSHDILVEQENIQKIENAIENLPGKCKQVFKMSRFEELKYNEIAEKLSVSVKAVEAQMTKALKLLREELKEFLPLLAFLYLLIKTIKF